MSKIPFGPTYEEMLNPSKIDPKLRKKALDAKVDELDPINLFNITWKNEKNEVNKIVLPKALTGVDANIIVMLGKHFPSGSHKVGPAYSTLIEGCVDNTIIPGEHTILGPSTGNFGIGVSYICNLMKYDSIVIMHVSRASIVESVNEQNLSCAIIQLYAALTNYSEEAQIRLCYSGSVFRV